VAPALLGYIAHLMEVGKSRLQDVLWCHLEFGAELLLACHVRLAKRLDAVHKREI